MGKYHYIVWEKSPIEDGEVYEIDDSIYYLPCREVAIKLYCEQKCITENTTLYVHLLDTDATIKYNVKSTITYEIT